MKVGTIAKQSGITFLATLFTSKATFDRVKRAVVAQDDLSTPNNEKRDAVVELLKDLGEQFGTFVLNLVVELAVTWIRAEQGKL